MTFDNYLEARKWADRALSARTPLDKGLQKWANEPKNLIRELQQEITEEQQVTGGPMIFLPVLSKKLA